MPASHQDRIADPSAPARPADACAQWTDFALHPLSHEIPVAWHPLVTQWTKHSARVRWETLTGTPLDLNWTWISAPAGDDRELTRKRLEGGWARESASAESQAKSVGAVFRWTGNALPLSELTGSSAEGTVRNFSWNERPGCLAVATLAAPGRRAFLSASLCPPEPIGAGLTGPQAIRRILRSLKLAGSTDPLRLAFGGLAFVLPAEYRVESLRGREGQCYVDCLAPGRRVGIARIGLSDLRLSGMPKEKVWSSLVRLLFERGEAQDPIETLIRAGTASPQPLQAEQAPQASKIEVQAHAGGLFLEKCRLHIRAGDWILRKVGRRWSGRAAAMAWTCPKSHALLALAVRCGGKDEEAAVRELLEGVRCHGRPEQEELDWRPFLLAEAGAGPLAMGSLAQHAAPGSAGKAEPPANPLEMRQRQLRFRVRARPEVRLEVSAKDGSGDLVYEGAPASGLLAGILRGRAKPEVLLRRLALDVVGRKIWEQLAAQTAPRVGEILAELCSAYSLHPVEAFPRLLEFLRMLGERRLVEGLPEEERAKKISSSQ